MDPLLSIHSLDRRYGAIAALRAVDLGILASEVVLLLGANGAGKSTLLRCVAGLMRPSKGEIRIKGRPLRDRLATRPLIGFLSHQTLLYDDLTARENLRFAAALYQLDKVEQRVRDALDAAALTPRADQQAGVLSHGLRQRLAIARAMLHAPELLLLDEPFTGLDRSASELLRSHVALAAARGAAVLCVTHQPLDLWESATRVVTLARGRVASDVPRPASIAGLDAA